MTCVIEYLDGKGRTTRRLLLEHRGEAFHGRMGETLLRVEEDGRDVTERQRNEEAKARHEEGRKADCWSIEETF